MTPGKPTAARSLSATLATACAALFILSAGVQAQGLSPAQMRGAAVAAVDQGQPELALRIAEALLVRDPDDVVALTLKAREPGL